MSKWTLKANKGGMMGANYTVLRDGKPTHIVIYDTSGLVKSADFDAFVKGLKALTEVHVHVSPKDVVLKDDLVSQESSDYPKGGQGVEWDDHARFEEGE